MQLSYTQRICSTTEAHLYTITEDDIGTQVPEFKVRPVYQIKLRDVGKQLVLFKYSDGQSDFAFILPASN